VYVCVCVGVCVCGVCMWWVWVCVYVCVCVYGYLSGRDCVMECVGGRLESRPVCRVSCSLLSTVL
jgi:hypothetical protein